MASDKRDLITRRFRSLIEELGAELGNVRGWKRRVAERLGITPGHLSRVLTGKRGVALDTAEQAAERLGLSLDFFLQEAPEPASYRDHAVRERGPQEQILDLLDLPSPDVAELDELAKKILSDVLHHARPSAPDVRRLAEGILQLPLHEVASKAVATGAPDLGVALASLFLTQRKAALIDLLDTMAAESAETS